MVAISVDGLNPDAIRELGPERAPSFHRLLDEGAGTLNARTAVEMSVTLPNHTGMLTGRRIERKTGHHVDFNEDNHSDVHTEAGAYRSSLFDVVHDRGGRTALYASKDKFALFDRSWGGDRGADDRVGRDHGRDKIDRFVEATPQRLSVKVAPADPQPLRGVVRPPLLAGPGRARRRLDEQGVPRGGRADRPADRRHHGRRGEHPLPA